MTKPIAILKDSIREAWDSKVLLVLIILSLLLALLLASVGYTAVPAETVYGSAKEDLRRVRLNRGNVPVTKLADFQRFNVTYEVKDFKTVESARNPANGRYSFTIAVTPGDPQNPVVSALDDGQPRRKDKDGDGDGDKGAKDAKDKDTKKDGEKKDGEKKDGEKKDGGKKAERPKFPFGEEEDNFGLEVLLWHIDAAEFIRKLQEAQGLNKEDQKKLLTFQLTDQMMVDFIRERLEYHYNVKVESVERTPGPLQGPQEFKVTTGSSDPRNWPHTVSLFFGAVSLEQMAGAHSLGQVVYALQNNLVNGVGAGLAIALGVIITSFFIPNMLRKGSVDLMLSKPINRPVLLIYKYLGGLSFMFIFAAVAVGSAWLVFGLRTGLWNPWFLILIPVLTFGFGILYALSTLMAVWTRSAIASLLVTLAFNGLLWVVTYVYNQIDSARNGPMKEFIPGWVTTTADIVHGVLPRTGDMDTITTKLVAEVMTENDRKKWESNTLTYPSLASVAVSLLWIAGCLGLACWRFSRKDY